MIYINIFKLSTIFTFAQLSQRQDLARFTTSIQRNMVDVRTHEQTASHDLPTVNINSRSMNSWLQKFDDSLSLDRLWCGRP